LEAGEGVNATFILASEKNKTLLFLEDGVLPREILHGMQKGKFVFEKHPTHVS